jgi:2-amino-4-hydroxy-6-hydroxymethyldihydropteridine diphosphokinase
MPRCWVSIGSNQERERSVRGAVQALRQRFGELILSSVYESDAVGFDGRPFLNLVAGLDTRESVASIRDALRTIEDDFGRSRGPDKFAPRTLDLDLLTYGDQVHKDKGLDLPRDEILRYAFVLGPLSEVAGDEVHPLFGRSYRELWNGFGPAKQSIVPVPFDLRLAG